MRPSTARSLSSEERRARNREEVAQHLKLTQRNLDWKRLREKVIREAQRRGYTYEAGRFYQPETIEARARVQNCLDKRAAVVDQGSLSVPEAEELAHLLAEDKRRFEQATDCRINCTAHLQSYVAWRWFERQKLAFAEYRDAILFDLSPQAQLVRCLTPPQESIHQAVNIKGPSFNLVKGFEASAETTFDIHLAHGEVEVFKKDFPERAKAQALKVAYLDYRGELRELNLGRFSLFLGARAWGFAGASLLLSTQLELNLGNTRYGSDLQPLEQATRPPTSDNKAQVQIDKGLISKFNVFAGVKSGIQVTGALNWAPPAEVVALSAYPVLSISGKQVLSRTSSWLTLARLTAEVGAAAGIGAQGEFALSLHKGRLILYLKAALISGPGASGSFRFEVGYDAIVDILNLFRRELHRNNNQPLKWVDEPAATFMSKMTTLGILGLDPAMVYLTAYDQILSLFEAITRPGRGGPVAHTIIYYDNRYELKSWIVQAPASALGALLYTLTSPPNAFTVDSTYAKPNEKMAFSINDSHLLQQQAISEIIKCITNNNPASKIAKTQFIEACIRMNELGSSAEYKDSDYQENRLKLDRFMRQPVLRYSYRQGDAMRASYLETANELGSLQELIKQARSTK